MDSIELKNLSTFDNKLRPDFQSASNKLLIYLVVAGAAILGTAATASASLAGKAVVLLGVTVALANIPHIVAIVALLVVAISAKAISNAITQEYREASTTLLYNRTEVLSRESLNTPWINRLK